MIYINNNCTYIKDNKYNFTYLLRIFFICVILLNGNRNKKVPSSTHLVINLNVGRLYACLTHV